MAKLPSNYRNFRDSYEDVWKAYDQLGGAIREAGPLDDKGIALAKLGLAIGAQQEGAVHSHVRKAVADGVDPEEIRQVALLAVTTLGFPSAMAAMSWVEDILSE